MTLIKKIVIEKKRLIKFLFVGLGGTVVNLLVVWLGNTLLFNDLDDSYRSWFSIGLAILISIFFNYILNYFWTWKDRRGTGMSSFLVQLIKYYLSSFAAATLQFCIAAALVFVFKKSFFPSQNELMLEWKLIASFSGIVFASILNFCLNHFWTFRISRVKEPH